LPSLHLINLSEPADEDVLCTALRLLVHRDLMDAATHLMEDVGWTPMTVEYARRLRDLNEQYQLWSEEPALIRGVLDETWR
jgi:hypothetical protein